VFLWHLAHQSLPCAPPPVRHNLVLYLWGGRLLEALAPNLHNGGCVWALVDESVTASNLCRLEKSSAKQWLFLKMESLSKEEFAWVSVTLWAIWYARTKVIFERSCTPPMHSLRATCGIYQSPSHGDEGEGKQNKLTIRSGSLRHQGV
jgi:hypothetical protein